MTKKIITESKDYVSPSDLDGKLSDLKRKIEDLIAEYGPDARLEYDAHFCHEYDTSPSPRFDVLVVREETDAEYKLRLIKEKTLRNITEDREREEYERLRAKFGS